MGAQREKLMKSCSRGQGFSQGMFLEGETSEASRASEKRSSSRGRSSFFKTGPRVPVVAQWLTHPTRNHEVSGLNPGLTQWVKDLALQ